MVHLIPEPVPLTICSLERHSLILLYLSMLQKCSSKQNHISTNCAGEFPFFTSSPALTVCRFLMMTILTWASQVVLVVKNLPAYAGNLRHRFDPWVRKIPWRRKWQPTPILLPGESHGQRNLAGNSP